MAYKLSQKEYELLSSAWKSLLDLSTSLTINHVMKEDDFEEAGRDVILIAEIHRKLNDMQIDHYINCKES